MKACPHCRAEYEDNLTFCTKDGSPLVDTEAPTADDIEIDTVLRKSDIAAVQPIDDLETQAWDPDEFEQTEYKTQSEKDSAEPSRVDVDFEEDFEDVPEEPVVYQKPIESEEKRSYLGLIVGAFLLFGILVLGAGLVGGFLYYQSQRSNETAEANTNQNANSTPDSQLDMSEDLSNTENTNTDETDEDGDLLGDYEITKSESRGKDSDKTKDKDGDQDEGKDKKKTPTPAKNESAKKDSTKTSETPAERKTPVPTPEPRTTPTPQRTPRVTPTPKKNIPSRISGGVVNGKAIRLPVPAYPSAARASRVAGMVSVQVVISKSGSVMSARAVSGHPLLRSAAVQAARRAKFRPTMLSGQPVEVSGRIVYNFRP
ncbi:MAG: TonB family protein [Pyrinomonadaceae bacterium]|nr:TonB family protein [Pyrinomonadaceae bacterium]